jgi:pilus assembly protein CpaB
VRTPVLAIVLAVVLAVVGMAAVLVYVRDANERAAAGLNPETVLRATGPIAAGTSVSEASDSLRQEDVPVSSLAGAGTPVHSVNADTGPKVITSAMTAGEILFTDMLAPAGSTTPALGGLAIPKGKYAVSVDACLPEDVAGYVTPGTYVAVFDVVVPAGAAPETPSCNSAHEVQDGKGLGGLTAVLVLSSAEVLRVGQSPASEGSTPESQAQSASSSEGDVLVTFAVTEQEAGDLAVLQQGGIPYLAVPGP